MPYEIHPAALAELHNALEYYWRISPALSGDFHRAYMDRRDRILEFPESFSVRPGSRGIRRANLTPQFETTYIAYTIREEKIIILAVAHAGRKQHYFRDRIANPGEAA